MKDEELKQELKDQEPIDVNNEVSKSSTNESNSEPNITSATEKTEFVSGVGGSGTVVSENDREKSTTQASERSVQESNNLEPTEEPTTEPKEEPTEEPTEEPKSKTVSKDAKEMRFLIVFLGVLILISVLYRAVTDTIKRDASTEQLKNEQTTEQTTDDRLTGGNAIGVENEKITENISELDKDTQTQLQEAIRDVMQTDGNYFSEQTGGEDLWQMYLTNDEIGEYVMFVSVEPTIGVIVAQPKSEEAIQEGMTLFKSGFVGDTAGMDIPTEMTDDLSDLGSYLSNKSRYVMTTEEYKEIGNMYFYASDVKNYKYAVYGVGGNVDGLEAKAKELEKRISEILE